jgi:glycerol uptake facilitator-like aquaporin
MVLSDGKGGTIVGLNLAWGLAVTMGILVSGGVSGV